MAALHEVGLPISADIRDALASRLWFWIHQHDDDEVLKLSIWIVRKTIRIRDLHVVFERLLGPDPAGGLA